MTAWRSMKNASAAKAIAGSINDWVFPDVPPIDSGMIGEIRGNIEMLTNCLSHGVIGEDEKEIYTELKDDFIDLGLAKHSVAASVSGDAFDARIRITVRRDLNWATSGIIWLTMSDHADAKEYQSRADDCISLVKGLCNTGKVEFIGSYQYPTSYG